MRKSSFFVDICPSRDQLIPFHSHYLQLHADGAEPLAYLAIGAPSCWAHILKNQS